VLLRYLALIHPTLSASSSSSTSSTPSFPRRDDLAQILTSGKTRPSTGFWKDAFDVEAQLLDASSAENDEAIQREIHGVRAVLEVIYTRWRDCFSGHTRRTKGSSTPASLSTSPYMQPRAQAGLRYAEWLLHVMDDWRAASNVIRTTLATSQEFVEKDEIERRWNEVLAAHEAEAAGATSTGADPEIGEQVVAMVVD
jgi:hypothetical protein